MSFELIHTCMQSKFTLPRIERNKACILDSKEKIGTKETRIHFISCVRQDGSRVMCTHDKTCLCITSFTKNISNLNEYKFSYDMI